MARPTKEEGDKLSATLPAVRCTASEKKLIQTRSEDAGLSVSEYVRRMVLNGQVIIKHNKTDFEATQQLRKLGVNLNQQTKKLNATGVLPQELKNLWQKLNVVLDQMME